MECPFCTADLPDDDVFCEACGKPLHAAAPSPASDGCTCGAPAEEIDEDGYCGRCGRLARRPASDHIEIVLSPDFAGVSDRGLHHPRNEDRFAIRQVFNESTSGFVLVVCDGVSSSRNSEAASSSVAENVANALEASVRRHSASSPERTVRSAIYDAQTRLIADAISPDDAPSTTVVAALVKGADVTIGWAGDSRAYWIADGGESQALTTDHSWLSEVIASGAMSPEEAEKAPMSHGITRWLGADAGENSQAAITSFKIPGPGHLLLCTDGLWNYAEDPGTQLPTGDAIEAARHLIDFANAQGGHDNITAVVLRTGN